MGPSPCDGEHLGSRQARTTGCDTVVVDLTRHRNRRSKLKDSRCSRPAARVCWYTSLVTSDLVFCAINAAQKQLDPLARGPKLTSAQAPRTRITYHPHHHAYYRYSIYCSHLFIELELFIATERQSCLSPPHPLYLHSIAYSLHTSTPSSALGAQPWTSSCPLSSSLHTSPHPPQTSATP